MKGYFVKVYCFDLNRTFDTVKECAKEFGVTPSSVSQSLKNGWCVKGHVIEVCDVVSQNNRQYNQ